jgi:hypothetical protein
MTAALDRASNMDVTDAAGRDGAPDQAVTAPPAVPAELGAAAIACLREALDRCDERGAALHLLAADALVTAACEAAGGAGSTPSSPAAHDVAAALAGLCDEFSVARLSRLVS